MQTRFMIQPRKENEIFWLSLSSSTNCFLPHISCVYAPNAELIMIAKDIYFHNFRESFAKIKFFLRNWNNLITFLLLANPFNKKWRMVRVLWLRDDCFSPSLPSIVGSDFSGRLDVLQLCFLSLRYLTGLELNWKLVCIVTAIKFSSSQRCCRSLAFLFFM